MTNLIYTLSLHDKVSANLEKIGITSKGAWQKFKNLQTQASKSAKTMAEMGGSVGALRQKLDLLKAEKEWIPSSNLQSIRAYNSEIKKLEKEINHLDTINGSVFKKNFKNAISNLPFSELITNPLVAAGTAIYKTSQMSMEFDKGMAAINTTAQLSKKELAGLKTELLGINPSLVTDWGALPTAYESIISQTGDVALSTDILKTSLKGSKAGFTEVETVSAALAQSLSLIGSKNASAEQVLDTFFAAKRVGAGEFKDFARYMPSLIASGDALGIKYKEVAGMFAYMTGKGQSAERATTLMENAFLAMSKVDIRKNLSEEGINVFDEKGNVRSMTNVFSDMKKRMSGMSDEAKSEFLAKMGITDKEARSAFVVMTSEIDKLKEAMNATKNASGETDKALDLSRSNGDLLRDMWSKIQRLGIIVGDVVGKILTPAFIVLGGAISVVTGVLGWFFEGLLNGSPLVYSLTIALGAWAIASNAAMIKQKALVLWSKKDIAVKAALAVWNGIVTASTWLWTSAQAVLNAVMMASPLTWIILAVVALIGVIVFLVTKIQGWGEAWKHTVNGAKLIFLAFVEYNKWAFNTMIDGIMIGINKIKEGWYKFKNAVGIGDKSANNKMLEQIKADTERRKKEITEGAKKVKDLEMQGGKEFILAGKSLSIKKGKDKVDEATVPTAGASPEGIVPPKTPGIIPADNGTGDGTGDTKKGQGSKSNESIATGGQRNTVINITMKNMVEQIKVTGKDFKESANNMSTELQDQMARVLAMAVTTAG